MKTRNPLHASAAVHYRFRVRDAASGRVVRRLSQRKRNLILDQGLNAVAARSWAGNFTYAVAGTGDDPVKRDSGAVTFTRAAAVVTASAGFFEAADAGRLLKFDTGEEMRITVFNSATSVDVDTAGALGASEGTVWYVDRTALETEVKRTNTYGGDGGDNETTFVTPTRTFKRTFVFSAEAGPVTYKEIGWSHIVTAGANLFGMDLLAGGGVALIAGQQLEVIVELSVSLTPAASTAWVNPVAGFGDDGVHGFEFFDSATVNAAGATQLEGLATLEPSVAKTFIFSTGTNAIQALSGVAGGAAGGAPVGASKALAGDAYVPGSFTRTFRGTFTVGQANGTTIRSGYVAANGGGTSYRFLMDSAGTKDSDHTLEIEFTQTWGRTLTN